MKKLQEIFLFHNFICLQFHPVQMNFEIVLIVLLIFRSFSINYTKLEGDLQKYQKYQKYQNCNLLQLLNLPNQLQILT